MTFIDASAPIAAHAAVKQNVHGVGANDIADVADISAHAAVTTNVHGTGAGNVIVGNDELSIFGKITSGSFTGNNTVNRAIPHGLGVTPKFVYIVGNHANLSHIVINGTLINSTNAVDSSQLAVTTANITNFYVGNATSYSHSANDSTYTFYWIAIG